MTRLKTLPQFPDTCFISAATMDSKRKSPRLGLIFHIIIHNIEKSDHGGTLQTADLPIQGIAH